VPKEFFDAGVASTSSSDYPVRDFFPMTRIAAGVKSGVSLETMIASHTINGAVEIFAERETGSIEVGKAADLVVMDRNLFELAPDDLATAKAILTMFAGKEVFRDPSF
jgi:predicted amidohydrolase YtcJ